jgi:tRNA pseudouridine13 synthase
MKYLQMLTSMMVKLTYANVLLVLGSGCMELQHGLGYRLSATFVAPSLRLRGGRESEESALTAPTCPSIASLDREASRRWNEKKDDVLQWEDSPRISDRHIGISEYVLKKKRKKHSKGTGGILKASWSDFRVTEVSLESRRPIQLTHTRHPGLRPPDSNYLHLVMAKIGYDTISAVGRLCTWLGCARDSVTYAGIKDKSAVTCQALTIDARAKAIDIDKLRNISRWIPRLIVGEFKWVRQRLTPGMHAGNYFTVLLRNMQGKGAHRAAKRVKSLRKHGFINYYGHQRFGLGMRSSMPTIEVGKALLLGKWDEAVALVMSPKYVSHPDELAAKQAFSRRWPQSINLPMNERRAEITRLASEALTRMPAHCFGEISLLRALTENKTTRQCVFAMPHRAMYMLAYWSRLWNKLASRRMRKFGNELVEGDLVASMRIRDVYSISDGNMNVTRVTQQDILSKKYSIRDLVLPLPGRAVTLVVPSNAVGSYLEKLLKKEGVYDLVSADESQKPHHFLKGKRQGIKQCLFRHLVVKPADFEYTVLKYSGDSDLFVCDDESGGHFASLMNSEAADTKSKGKEEDKFALQLRFGLPPAAFATMLIRQITRESVHPALHCEKRRVMERERGPHMETKGDGKEGEGRRKRVGVESVFEESKKVKRDGNRDRKKGEGGRKTKSGNKKEETEER